MISRSFLIGAAASLLAACSEPSAQKADAVSEPVRNAVPLVDEVADIALLTGEPGAGRVAFNQCRSCHTVEPGVHRVGPSLAGVVGRPIGTVADYRFSTAMAAAGGHWDDQSLFEFLEDPREHIPGNRMGFPGIRDAQRRADLIAYLKTEAD